MSDDITLDEMIEQTHRLAAHATKIPPCMRMLVQESSCINIEAQRPLESSEMKKGATRRAYSMYNVEKLCSACAAYWFLSMAEIELRHVKKMNGIR